MNVHKGMFEYSINKKIKTLKLKLVVLKSSIIYY